MTTAERSLKKILQLAADQHDKYAQALKDSMVWDREADEIPSASDLKKWHQLSLEALEAQLVLLSKAEAANLLMDVGHPIGLPTLKRNTLGRLCTSSATAV